MRASSASHERDEESKGEILSPAALAPRTISPPEPNRTETHQASIDDTSSAASSAMSENSVQSGSRHEPRVRMPRECPCGERLSGKCRKIAGVEVCQSCRMRHSKGLPQLLKARHPSAASSSAASPARTPRFALPEIAPMPSLPGVAYPTRFAYAAAAAHEDESTSSTESSVRRNSALGQIDLDSQPLLRSSAAALMRFSTRTSTIVPRGTPAERAAIALVEQPDIAESLRIAMYLRGDTAKLLPERRHLALARRFLHQRIRVARHTAAAVVSDATKRAEVVVLRDFPGALPPHFDSVTAFLRNPTDEAGRHYSFNERGQRIHVILHQKTIESSEATRAFDWWRPIMRHYGVGIRDDLEERLVWTFISRRGGSALHVDGAHSLCTQYHGRKLWVLVDQEEARAHEIVQVEKDVMRDAYAGSCRLSAWLACESFRWCILEPGDTIVFPANYLHAVQCIGDEDSVSAGAYFGVITPPPPQPRPTSPPPSAVPMSITPEPLPILQKAFELATSSRAPPLARAAAAILSTTGFSTLQAAALSGTSPSTVMRWKKHAREAGDVEDAPRSGRPKLTTPLEDGAILRASELNHFASNKMIRHQLALSVSEDTIGRRLDAAGLPSRIAANKIHYSDDERRKRLSFAHGYEAWTAEQWERVIFSDEVTIEGEGRKRHQRVRRPEGHRFDPEYSVHTQIYAPSQHIFACFCSRGPGFCEMYEGKLDGKALKGLLARTLLETAGDYYDMEHGEHWWLVHDNSPQFKSREVQTWLHNNGISVLDFPPRSPDLNPIENMWPRIHALTDKLHPTTNEAMADAFIKCWPEISLDIFTDYAQSMPARIAAVIEADGNATKY